VLQDFVEQLEQLLDDDDPDAVLSAPWIPKVEKSFRTSGRPQPGQQTSFSRPTRTSRSKRVPQARQRNS
jgi:hypothetical protein